MALPNADAPLAAYSTGTYGDLRQKLNPNAEETAALVRRAAVMLLARGFRDIDPETLIS